jgi:CheY-like chemotaxis protein
MLHRVIGENVQVVTSLGPALGKVRADPGQIEQVLMNLAINARDAMPGGGRLAIETSNVDLDEDYVRFNPEARTGPHVMLTVSDTGYGMDSATLARIFEPFFTTKSEGQGTGLGLATVYGTVRQSEGTVTVHSEPGKGTTFRIYLPRVTSPSAADAAARPAPPPGGSETILIVEDADPLRVLVRELLENAGYTVLEACGPHEALAAAARIGPIHLLLTDVMMPQMNGREMALQISALKPGVRVVFMSGYTDEVVGHHGMLDEPTGYLQKPFTMDVLLAKIRAALDPGPAGC